MQLTIPLIAIHFYRRKIPILNQAWLIPLRMNGGGDKASDPGTAVSQQPELLPPQPLLAPAPLVMGGVLAGALAIAAFAFLWSQSNIAPTRGNNAASDAPKTISMSTDQVPGAFKVLDKSVQDTPGSVIAQLQMPEAEKNRLAERLADGSVRLAAVWLWDTMDEDGDTVEISAAGFSQTLVITHKHRAFFLPLQPGGSVSIRAVRDGGGGGVTLGVSTVIGPVPLPRLAVGQIVEIPAI